MGHQSMQMKDENNNFDAEKTPVTVSSASSLDSCLIGGVTEEELRAMDEQRRARADSCSVSVDPSLHDTASLTMPNTDVIAPPDHIYHDESLVAPPPPPITLPPTEPAAAADMTVPASPVTNNIPEFLFQLTKMLTDDNREIIDWSNGKIEVHSPTRLEQQVLNKYFRHSRFASFQRQLNYFGFRKLAGKGKMAPCSYVNEATGPDIGSLLLIKRKGTNATGTSKDAASKRPHDSVSSSGSTKKAGKSTENTLAVDPVLAGIFERNSRGGKIGAQSSTVLRRSSTSGSGKTSVPAGASHQALAKTAVGRGVRHSFSLPGVARMSQLDSGYVAGHPGAATAQLQTTTFDFPQSDSLSQLAANYRNSLNDLAEEMDPTPLSQMQNPETTFSGFTGFLSRDSSLVDLAMIAPVEDGGNEDREAGTETEADVGFGFIDFPNPEIIGSNPETGNEGRGE